MHRSTISLLVVAVAFGAVLTAQTVPGKGRPATAATRPAPTPAHSDVAKARAVTPDPALVKQYCTGCHNDRAKAGGLTLELFDPSRLSNHIEVAEKMIKKLRLNMMPPPGAKRPEAETLAQFAAALETSIDGATVPGSNPGVRVLPRLTRAEYARSVRELLDLEVDVNAFLPPDTMSDGFENVSDVQTSSPMLLDGYLRAASQIANLALGDRAASSTEATYKVPRAQNQMRRVAGAPWGTRGGVAVTHIFPADGTYTFRTLLHGDAVNRLFGRQFSRSEQLEISIDGRRVALLDIDYSMTEERDGSLNLTTPPVHVASGPRAVVAAFVQTFDGAVPDLLEPIDFSLADSNYGADIGITALPHVRDFTIAGPHGVTGVSSTPSRRKIFTCRPVAPVDELACARQVVTRLAREAYRRPVSDADLKPLMGFFEDGRAGKDFEAGIKVVLQAILASPHFLFRVEEVPASARPGQTYSIGDLDLASRLSYFIWSRPPDDELLRAAVAGTLGTPPSLEKQVRRMLAHPHAEALATRFGGQFLRLQDVDKIQPDALLYPSFDADLAAGFKRETELLFNSIVREDRNVLDLLTADYTFVNERVAKVYGIPNVAGPAFRRVTLTDPNRRGILSHGSVLLQTSIADRTSPVHRGKWIMEVLLGSPPPPPPPNIPALEQTDATSSDGKPLTVRARMEQHRANPSCNSCHRFIDPLGLSLESFDVIGASRIKDSGAPIDTAAKLWDGSDLSGPSSLPPALLRYSEPMLRNFTERLLIYALGRRVEYFDQPTVRAIVREAAKNGNKLSAFVVQIAMSPAFRMTKAETSAAEATVAAPSAGGVERK